MSNAKGSEALRKLVHMSMGLFALLLKYLTPLQAAGAATLALIHNIWIMPRVWGHKVYREGEVKRGIPFGIIVYPFSVLLLIVFYRNHMFIAAGAWAVMAFGDGMAGIIGKKFGKHHPPWHQEKTWEGVLGFTLGGWFASAAFLYWMVGKNTTPYEPLMFFGVIPLVVSFMTGFVETFPLKLDDNITVPLLSGFLFYIAYVIFPHIHIPRPFPWIWFAMTAGINAFLALTFLVAGWVDRSGAFAGFITGWLTLFSGGWWAFYLLFGFFLLGNIATKLGKSSKEARGIAEKSGRSAGNVLAKSLPQTVAFLLAYLATPQTFMGRLFLLAGFIGYVTATMDTVSSEIGKWLGKRTFLWWRLKKVPPGTEGGMSLEGTLGGLIGAGLLLYTGHLLSPVPYTTQTLWLILGTALIANLLESLMGAYLQPKDLATNEEVNLLLICTSMVLGVILIPLFRIQLSPPII